MKRTVLNVQQGTQEWLAARAASDGTASEAPAMMGHSKYQTRTDLLDQRKHGISKDVDAGTQALFDRGHAAEALARPIAEEIIGEELSPTTIVLEIDGMKLLASLDGITFDDEVIWEHKLYSESLAEQIRSGNLDEHYTIQMDQELLVSGAKKCLFMTSDGTKEKCVWMWYESSKKKADSIVVGWQQFHKDLANHEPRIIAENPQADVVMAFPALYIQSEGAIAIKSNLEVFGAKLREFVEGIDMEPNDDQGFANAEEAVKVLQKAQDALEQAESNALAMAPSVDEMRRTVAMLTELARKSRIALEKVVKNRKEQIKMQIVLKASAAFDARVLELESEIKPIRLIHTEPAFAEAVKNKRTLASLHDAVDTALAHGLIELDHVASGIRGKLAWFKSGIEGYGFLFPDIQDLIQKQSDDFKLVVNTRIEQHQKAEAERVAEMVAAANKLPTLPDSVVKETMQRLSACAPAEVAPVQVIDTGATIKLGQICERLGFTVSAEFIRSLGVEPAGRERAAVLYREADFPKICDWLIGHIQSVRNSAIEGMRKAA